MSKIQNMRNAHRFRRVARRTQTKNQIDTGVHDQLLAIAWGLTDDPRKDLKVEGEDEEQMFLQSECVGMKSILDILDDMVISGIEEAGDYIVLCGCEDAPCCGCNL
ncbi:MAG: hypothetical protein CM15mV52_0520 [uncultured marine virus]|nr:MAG: hypothetical protein CM15mV52_0520 [uncultured marine virus]